MEPNNKKKVITNEQYWHALALYIVASKKRLEVDELQKELGKVLGVDEHNSHIIDALYGADSQVGTQEEFDTALRRQGVLVKS